MRPTSARQIWAYSGLAGQVDADPDSVAEA